MNDKPELPTARALASAISAELGGTVVPPRPTEPGDTWAERAVEGYADLDLPGTCLSLHSDNYKKRLHVSVNWPIYEDTNRRTIMRPNEFLPWDERKSCPVTSITCDPLRAPEKIAADIKRRLFPQAVDLYALALVKIKEFRDASDQRGALAERICIASSYHQESHTDRSTLYGPGDLPTLEIHTGDRVYFKPFSVDELTARKVLAVLEKAGLGKT